MARTNAKKKIAEDAVEIVAAEAAGTEEANSNALAELNAFSGGEGKTDKGAKEEPKMLKVLAEDVMVQPRTLRLPRPTFFYFEPASPRRKVDEGNDTNQIERGVHQVDPNRIVSECPVMPNLKLLAETGNPYPLELEGVDFVVTAEKYLPRARFCHAVWAILKDKGVAMTAMEILPEAVALSGWGYKKNSKEISADAERTAFDTLRDLRCYGLVEGSDARPRMKTTKFWIVKDPTAIAYTDPVAA